jgi:hypothetical protein
MLLYLLAVIIDEPATAPPAALKPAAPPHNYLKPPSCDKGGADEVVVCGDTNAEARYRLKPVEPGKYDDAPVRAETKFAGGALGVTASQVMLGGTPSNRIMLNFKIKL